MKKISIIVPVYNAEGYLRRTVDALVSQTYGNIEIILVDDGSTDGSYAICEELERANDRITSYTIPNGGPAGARNFGMKQATGEYVGFCDSDDIPAPEMYATLARYLERESADISLCDIYSERDGGAFGFPWEDGKTFDREAVASELMGSMIGNTSDNDRGVPVWGSSVRCLFKREILENNGIIFPEDIHFAEDLVFVLRYLSFAQRAVVCDKPLYFYTNNGSSIMNSFYSYKRDMLAARLSLVSHVEDVIKRVGKPELRGRLTVSERCYYHECVGNACRGADRTRRDKISEIKSIVNESKVRAAFRRFDALDIKTRIKYSLIKYRCKGLLYLYYSMRLR